jgi:2-dehydro-3-deoxygluconokinase
MPALVTFGEGLGILRTRGVGSVAQLGTLVVSTGGSEGNVAIGASRLGTPVRWLGRIGADGLGRRVARELRAEGVQVIDIVDPSAPTGALIKESPAPGRTRVTHLRAGSAGSRLNADDMLMLALEPGDILHVTGITAALSDSARAALLRALDLADEAGATISYDVNHRRGLWSDADAAPVHRSLAERAAIVFAGEEELPLIGGDPTAFPHPCEVIVKRGERGATAYISGATHEVAAVPVAVVDTVGAGDAFVAGYLSARLADAPIAQRLELAAFCGAQACTAEGDWEGAPFAGDLHRQQGDPVSR